MNITDICNMALSYLAKDRIVSINEDNEAARQCKIFYPIVKQTLLRSYDWGFAKKVDVLAELNVTHPRWDFVYVYPQKCVRLISIYDEHYLYHIPASDRQAYEVFMANDNTRAIGCDIENAYVEYIYDADDASVFPADFVEAFAHLLASSMAIQLTGNMDIKTTEYNLANNCLISARARTAMERQHSPEFPINYTLARW